MGPKKNNGSPALKPYGSASSSGPNTPGGGKGSASHVGEGHGSSSAHGSSSSRPKGKSSDRHGSSKGQGSATGQKRAHDGDEDVETYRMDFSKLDDATIHKYCALHKPKSQANVSSTRKPEEDERTLAARHFDAAPPPYEPDAIAWFLYAVKRQNKQLKLTLDHFSERR